jgi:hypothetical protein
LIALLDQVHVALELVTGQHRTHPPHTRRELDRDGTIEHGLDTHDHSLVASTRSRQGPSTVCRLGPDPITASAGVHLADG